ncbi:MAG: CpsD/CapB family tyrosine-protein kinase [Acidobacteriia bacterium]|nr:CpsD/CapB family tyrosine-protein kinase [Terriglobia bacterium]
MSRTFELLQRLEKEQATGAPSVPPTNGHRPALPAPVGEEVTRLVQQIFRGAVATDRPRVVVFSSVAHGDGCSWVCTNTALTLAAQNAGSICLVDANLRTPSLHAQFGIENRVGLSDAMVQPGPIRDFAQQIAGSNLWVLPTGSAAGSQAQLNFEILRVRLTELCAEFETVLIDAPPASLYSDAAQIGRLADGVVLVLQSNTTRRESALKVKDIFEAASVRLLGAVLNKRTFPIPQKLYNRL